MSSTPRFAHCDIKRPDGFYVQFVRVTLDDDDQTAPDKRDEGFWPSRDTTDGGYVVPEHFDAQTRCAQERMAAWERGDWNYIGTRARALCLIVHNGVGTYVNLDSPGQWGTESDSDEGYLESVYQEEIAALKEMIAAMQNPIYE